jgi:hypothetical protein
MIRTQVYIPDDQYNQLKLLAATGDAKFSDLIREGIDEIIMKKEKTRNVGSFDVWKDFIGKGKGGTPKNLSGNIDKYLYVDPYKTKKK